MNEVPFNPYRPPVPPAYDPPPSPGGPRPGWNPQDLPPRVLDYLSRTQMWARLVSVVVLILLAISIATSAYGASQYGVRFSLGLLLSAGNTAVTIVAFWRLSVYASAITRLRSTRGPVELEDAMLQQKLFWKLMAMSAILSLLELFVTILSGRVGGLGVNH